MVGGQRPARTTVQVAALPQEGLRVEIDAVAYVPDPGANHTQRHR
jgi:2-iminobutanoate/2-iminopropanoate deaminase